MEYPVLLKKNYINGDDTFTVSTGGTAIGNVYDWNRGTTWQSIGSDDLTNETIEAVFYEGSDTINRTIDRLIMLDTNIKDFELEYWDGAAWQTAVGTDIDNNADGNVYVTFTQVTTSKVRLNMLKTIVADQEKYLSQLIITEYRFQLSRVKTTPRQRVDETREASMRVGDGSGKHVRDYSKYTQSISIQADLVAIRNNLKSLYDENLAFIIVWTFDDMVDAEGGVYFVNWHGGFNEKPFYKARTLTWTIVMRVREV